MSIPPACRSTAAHASALADSMLDILSAQRSVNSDSYPVTLGHLAHLSGTNANPALVKQAARKRRFMEVAIAAQQDNLLAPVTLKTDLSLLAESHQTLCYLLNVQAKNKTRAYTVASLKKLLAVCLRQPFQESVDRQIADDKLPPDVGCVASSRGKPHLFRLKDLMPEAWRKAIEQSQSVSTKPPFASSDFSQEFESVFEQLDRAQGSFNFVTLDELRTSLPGYSREEFDARLRELRLARRYRLSGAENRNDVSAQQRDAGIREAGSLLLYAQRIKS